MPRGGRFALLDKEGENKTVAVESGIANINLSNVCDESNPLRLVTKPRIAFQLNQSRLQEALNRLLPAPLHIEVDKAELDDPVTAELFPSLRIVFVPSVSVSGTVLQGDKISLRLMQKGIQLDTSVALTPLEAALRSLNSGLRYKRPRLMNAEFNKLTFSIKKDCYSGEISSLVNDRQAGFTATGEIPAPLKGLWPSDVVPVAIDFCSLQREPSFRLTSPNSAEVFEKLSNKLRGYINVSGYSVAVTGLDAADNALRVRLTVTGPAASDGNPFKLVEEVVLPLEPGEAATALAGKASAIAAAVSAAVLNDTARAFVTKVTEALDGAFGGTVRVRRVSLPPQPVSAEIEAIIPGLKPINFSLAQGDINAQAPISVIREALQARASQEIVKALGNEVTLGGLKLTDIALDPGQGADALWISGKLHYTGAPAPITVTVREQLLPTLGVPQVVALPNVAELVGALDLLHSLNQMLSFGEGSTIKPEIVMNGTTPYLYITAKVNVASFGDGGIAGEVKLYARPGDQQLHFANKLKLECSTSLCWFPIASGLDIGNPQGLIDLEHPDQFEIDASLAITPGAQTQHLISFVGGIARDASAITLNGSLSVGGSSVTKTTGAWHLKDNVLTFESGPTGAASFLPLPRLALTLDPPHCLFAGGLNASFLGLSKLDIGAALIFGGLCGRQAGAPASDYARKALSNCSTSSDAQITMCGNGDAAVLGAATAHVHFVTRLIPPKLPTIEADFNLLSIAQIDARLSPVLAKLSADLSLIKVVILLPSLESVTADQLAGMLKSLLKPSLSLEALKNREVIISTFPPGDGDVDPSDSTSQTAGETQDRNSQMGGGPQPRGDTPPPPRITDGQGATPPPVHHATYGTPIPSVWPSQGAPYGASCGPGPVADVTSTDGKPIWTMRMTDACLLVGTPPKRRIISRNYDYISNKGHYLLACDYQNCGLDRIEGFAIVEVDDPTRDRPQEDLAPINFLEMSPAIFQGPARQTFEAMNSLIDFIFARQGKSSTPLTLDCLVRTLPGADEPFCALAIAVDSQTTPPTVTLFASDRSPKQVKSGSVLDRLYTFYCSNGQCTVAGKKVLPAMFADEIRVLGFWGDAKEAATIVRAPQLRPSELEPDHQFLALLSFNKDGASPAGRLDFTGDDPGLSQSYATPTWSRLWDDFVQNLHAKLSDQTWRVMMSREDRHSIVSAAPSVHTETSNVIVAMERDDGTVWTCVKTYEKLQSVMRAWKSEPDNPRLEPDRYDEIATAKNPSLELLKVLTIPKAKKGFQVNPLLLFGNPSNGSSCS